MPFAAVTLVVASIVLTAGNAREVLPPAFDEVTLAQPSSHVAWGVPLKGGSIRTLFIAPRFTMRDVAELSQRLDIDRKEVPLWDAHHLGLPSAKTSEAETIALVQKRLAEKTDVVVLGNFDLALLPADTVTTLLEKVKSGAGLVLVNYRHDPVPEAIQAFIAAAQTEDKSYIVRGIGE